MSKKSTIKMRIMCINVLRVICWWCNVRITGWTVVQALC